MASVVDFADDAIVCHDRDGRITSWNPAAERLLGYAAADIIGRDIAVLFPPESQHEEAAALARILSGEGGTTSSDSALAAESGQLVELSVTTSPIRDSGPAARQSEEDEVLAKIRAGVMVDHFETQRQAKDGRLIDVSLSVSPIRDRTGRIVGASKIARDILEHKWLIEERRIATANVTAESAEITGPVTVTAR